MCSPAPPLRKREIDPLVLSAAARAERHVDTPVAPLRARRPGSSLSCSYRLRSGLVVSLVSVASSAVSRLRLRSRRLEAHLGGELPRARGEGSVGSHPQVHLGGRRSKTRTDFVQVLSAGNTAIRKKTLLTSWCWIKRGSLFILELNGGEEMHLLKLFGQKGKGGGIPFNDIIRRTQTTWTSHLNKQRMFDP